MFLRVNGLFGWVRTNDRRSIALFGGFVAALNVDFDNRLSAGDVERIVGEIERAVQAEFPSVTRVYVRPHEDAGIKFGESRGLE